MLDPSLPSAASPTPSSSSPRPDRAPVGRRSVGLGALALLGGVLSACAPARETTDDAGAGGPLERAAQASASSAAVPGGLSAVETANARAAAAALASGTIRLQIFGDSITVGETGWYPEEAPARASWVPHLSTRCAPVRVKAKSGATAQLLALLSPPSAPADVVLFAFGTNDRAHGRTVQQVCDDLAGFVGRYALGTRPALVAVSAIGPRTTHGTAAELAQWNTSMALECAARGWLFLDPWTALRGADAGQWADPSLTKDGLHPTEVGAMLLGQGYERALAWALADTSAQQR